MNQTSADSLQESNIGIQLTTPISKGTMHCSTTEGHCITCSDEAVAVKVVYLDATNGLAIVMREDEPDIQEEIDITLLDTISLGDMVLAHGGVAIAQLKAAGNE